MSLRIAAVLLLGLLPLALLHCVKGHEIGYPILPPAKVLESPVGLLIEGVRDARPEREATGADGEEIVYASRDGDFARPPIEGIAAVLALELRSAGFDAVLQDAAMENDFHPAYRLLPTLRHFAARVEAAEGHDLYFLHVEIDALVISEKEGRVLMNSLFREKKEFKLIREVSRPEPEDGRPVFWKWDLPIGRPTGNDLALQLLDEQLRAVVGRIRDGAVAAVRAASSEE